MATTTDRHDEQSHGMISKWYPLRFIAGGDRRGDAVIDREVLRWQYGQRPASSHPRDFRE